MQIYEWFLYDGEDWSLMGYNYPKLILHVLPYLLVQVNNRNT